MKCEKCGKEQTPLADLEVGGKIIYLCNGCLNEELFKTG